MVFLCAGWLAVPAVLYGSVIGLYLIAVVLSGLMYLEPLTLPFYIIGVVLDHVVRAFAVPFGMINKSPHDGPSSREP
jgi:hypothetical protein